MGHSGDDLWGRRLIAHRILSRRKTCGRPNIVCSKCQMTIASRPIQLTIVFGQHRKPKVYKGILK